MNINGRAKVRAALTIYDYPVSLIDRILGEKTDLEWDSLMYDWTKFAKSKEHKNIAGVVVATISFSRGHGEQYLESLIK